MEHVDLINKRVTVANEAIAGGMAAMSMTYSIDNDAMLVKLMPGDKITAQFREGEMKLYSVEVMQTTPPPASQPGLKLEALEAMALANNPTLAQSQANIRVAVGQARQAGLYPNPTIGYYGDEIRGGYYGGGKQGGYINQTIVTGGKLQAARRVAELAGAEAKTNAEAQRMRVLNNVRSMFYQVLARQRLVEVRQSLAQIAADATETSHQLANIGQADRPDVLQTEVEQRQANIAVQIAQQSLRSAWRGLAATVGQPALSQTHLEGDLDAIPDLSYDDWLAKTLQDSPGIKLAQQSADRADAMMVQARKAPLPDLQISANLTQNYEPLESTGKPVGLNGGVQIGVQIPIFNHSQGAIAAAKAETEFARLEVTRTRLQIARDTAELFREYDTARAIVQQYKTEMLPRAEQAYNLYRASYQKMAAAYPQALLSQRTLFQLRVEYVQALEAAWQSAIHIQGFGLMDGLMLQHGPLLP